MKKTLFVVMILAAAAYIVMGMAAGLIFSSGGHDVYAKEGNNPGGDCYSECSVNYNRCMTNAGNDNRKKELCSHRQSGCTGDCARKYPSYRGK
jgi:hypothetical protein